MKISNVFFGQRPFKNEPLYASWRPDTIQSLDVDKKIKWLSTGTPSATVPTTPYGGFGTHGSYFGDSDGKEIFPNKTAYYEVDFQLSFETNETSGIGSVSLVTSRQDTFYGSGSSISKSFNSSEQFVTVNGKFNLGLLKKGESFHFLMGGIFQERWSSKHFFTLREVDRNIRN